MERKNPLTHRRSSKYDVGQKYGLALLNLVTSANEKYLFQVMIGGWAFSNDYHLLVLREERRDGQKTRDGKNDAKLNRLVGDLIGTHQRLILRAISTGAWMNVRGTTVIGI